MKTSTYLIHIRNRWPMSGFRGLILALSVSVSAWSGTVNNPFIPADVPDISMVRAGTKYYMSSTTMHFCPGLPIMESDDLINWRIASYAYETLGQSDAMNLANGKEMYGNGSWASSLRYKNGTFWVLVSSNNTGKTYLYKTTDVHKTPWILHATFSTVYYDPSLFFDDDGKTYIACMSNNIKLVQLNADMTAAQGINTTIVTSAQFSALSATGLDEGSHLEKINGWYYQFNIAWPQPKPRTIVCFRSKNITGPYEGKIVLQDAGGHDGVAQGSVFQMADSSWMGYAFSDHGAVGRLPWLVPVTWQDNWPVFNGGKAPTSFSLANATAKSGMGVVSSDDFSGSDMRLEWQWNHNPDAKNWSLTARPGYYRITTSRVDNSLLFAKNSLSQRSIDGKCSGRIAIDASGMKDGDIAGLAAFQDSLGYIGIKNNGGVFQIVKYYKETQETSVTYSSASKRVYLRIDMDFGTKMATFFYGSDSTNWKQLGAAMRMNYTLGMFVGYRFLLFNYATKSAGGYADFDWYKIGANAGSEIQVTPIGLSSLRPSTPVMGRAGALSLASGAYRLGDRTAIDFLLERPGRVEVRLATPDGRAVGRFAEIRSNSGRSTATFSSNIPSGQYLAHCYLDGRRLDTRSIVVTR